MSVRQTGTNVSIAYSVVIPDLHSPRIGEVLESLRLQEGTLPEYEILVVGRDRYGLVVRQRAMDPRIRFLESERDLNPAEARNRGVKAAQGKLIFFIDADCIADRQWMRTLLNAYEAGYPVAGGPIWFEASSFPSPQRGEGQGEGRMPDYWILCDNVAHFHDLLPDIGRGPNRHYMLATANMMVEKAILEKVGMFDETFPAGEDFGLSLRIRQAGYDLFFEPEARILHRPARDTLGAVLRHSAGWARHSIRVRTKYREELNTPWFLYLPMILRLLSPAIAATVTVRIFWRHPCIRRYWYTAPVVFLTKLVWCWIVAGEVAAGRYLDGFADSKDPS